MAYGILYTAQFKDRLLASTFKVDILQDGYGGGSTTIGYMGVTPVSLKYKSDKGKDQHIIGSSLTFSFMSLPADNDKYDALFVGAEKEFKVNYYKDSVLIWTGYLQPDNLSRSYFNKLYQITLNASDWLANLKNVEFRNGSSNYTDGLSVLETVKTCLEFTGIALDFYTQINTWETTYMTSTTDVLNNLFIHLGRFTKTENGKTKYTSVYDVIKEVLKPHNISLKQVGGRYHLINIYEIDSFYRIHTWSTLAAGSRTATDHIINIDSFNFLRDSSLTKLKPQLRLDVERFADDQGGELIADTDDFTGGGPWTIVAPDGYTNSIDQIVITTNVSVAESYIRISTASQTGIAGRYLDIQFDTFFEIYEPHVFIRIKVTKPISGESNNRIFVGDDLLHYQNPIRDIFELDEDGVYIIEINFDEDVLVTSDPVDWTIQNVRINVQNIDETEFDRNYIGYIDQNAQVKDLELFFADGDTDTDRGAFKAFSSGYVKTVAWNRYNETDGLTIQEIYVLNLLKNRQAYKDSISILAFDDSFEINASTIIQIDTTNYKIIELEAVDNNNTKKLLLEELLTSDPTYTFTSSILTSVGGQSTGSSDPTGEANNHGDLSGLANDDHNAIYYNKTSSDARFARLAAANAFGNFLNTFLGQLGIGSNDTPAERALIYDPGTAAVFLQIANSITTKANNKGLYIGLQSDERGYFGQRSNLGIDLAANNTIFFSIDPTGEVIFKTHKAKDTDGISFERSDGTIYWLMENDGDFHVEGDVIAFSSTVSDKRLKENIKPLENALSKILKIKGVSFKYIKDSDTHIGILAQDLLEIIPELVSEKKLPIHKNDDKMYYVIRYTELIPYVIEAIKEQQTQIEENKKEIEKLKMFNLNQWQK